MIMDKTGWQVRLLDLICITGLCILLYSTTLRGDFVYDDWQTIVNNPYIKNLKYVPDYFDLRNQQTWSFHQGQHGFYRPILLASFALNYHIGKLDPFSYHLANLILHIVNSLLVYHAVLEISDLFRDKPRDPRTIALMTALVFASHPIQTEAVSYIVSRSSLLSTFFILCSFIGFMWSIQEHKGRRHVYRIASILSFVMGLLVKEIAVVVPLLVLAVSALYRTSFEGRRGWYRAVLTGLPYFVLLAVYLPTRMIFLGKAHLLHKRDMLLEYLLTAAKGVFVYLKLMVFPAGQSVDHFLPIARNPWEPSALLACAVLLGFVWLAVTKIRTYSNTLCLWSLWLIIAFLPNLVLPTMEPVSEHSAYFPSVGFFAGITFVVVALLHRYAVMTAGPFRIACTGLFLVVIMQLGFLTLGRNLVWLNSVSLWEDAVKKAPQKVRPHQNLGTAYLGAGRLDLAISEFQTVLSLAPGHAEALSNLGIVYARTGDYEKSIEAFNNSIAAMTHNPDGVNNLGFVLMIQGRVEAAIAMFERALRMRPDDAIIYTNLGRAYYQTGDRRRACDCFESAARLDPDYTLGVEFYRKLCPAEAGKEVSSDRARE